MSLVAMLNAKHQRGVKHPRPAPQHLQTSGRWALPHTQRGAGNHAPLGRPESA